MGGIRIWLSPLLFLGLVTGILLSHHFVALIITLESLLLCPFLYKTFDKSSKSKPISAPPKFLIFLPLVMIIMGAASIQFKENALKKAAPLLQKQSLQVRVLEDSERRHQGQKFLAKALPDGPKIVIHTPQKNPYHYGDLLLIQGQFTDIPPITNPGQMNYEQFLNRRGILGIFKASEVTSQGKQIKNPFKWAAIQIRKQVHEVFQSSVPPPYDALLIGLVFGDHGIDLSDELEERFRHVGLTHLLVVSGSQVSLLSGIILLFLQKLNLRRKRIVLIIWITNIIFFFMTGGGASIFRAALMNSIATGLWGLHRNSTPLHICSITALIMCLISPYYLTDAGAQLSFLATFSLLYGVPPIEKKLPQKWPSSIRTALATALAPFIWTTPLTASLFHAVSPISLLSNIAAVQAIEWLVIVGFSSAFIGLLFAPLSVILNHFCLLIMKALTWLVTLLEAVPGGQFYIPSFPVGITLLMYALIVMLFFPLPFQISARTIKVTALLTVISIIGLVSWFALPGKWLTITSLDVGQGDATLIQTPSKKVILIDAGLLSKDWATGRVKADMGKQVVLPALRHLGINKIDLLIVTHFHADHVGGVPAILEKIPIGTLMDNGCPKTHFEDYNRLKSNFHTVTAEAGTVIPLEKDLTIEFLYPFKNLGCEGNENNLSVVIKITHGEHTFLITGDLEEEGEQNLVSTYEKELDVDVLKLGHHGSKTSTTPEFLNATSPKLALISSGRKNRYGHPHPSVIERVKALGIPIFNTAKHGAIILQSDGTQLRVKTILPFD